LVIVRVHDRGDRALLDAEQSGRDLAKGSMPEGMIDGSGRHLEAADAHDVGVVEAERGGDVWCVEPIPRS
jgi:hypothetical protein